MVPYVRASKLTRLDSVCRVGSRRQQDDREIAHYQRFNGSTSPQDRVLNHAGSREPGRTTTQLVIVVSSLYSVSLRVEQLDSSFKRLLAYYKHTLAKMVLFPTFRRYLQAQEKSTGDRAVAGLADLLREGSPEEKAAKLRGESGTVWLAFHPDEVVSVVHRITVAVFCCIICRPPEPPKKIASRSLHQFSASRSSSTLDALRHRHILRGIRSADAVRRCPARHGAGPHY